MRWLFLLVVLLVIEIYAFQAFKTVSKNGLFSKIYLLINAIIFLNFFLRVLYLYQNELSYSDQFYDYLSVPFALFFTLICFKLSIILFLFFEDISRAVFSIINFFFNFSETKILERRSFLSKIALLLASIPLPFILYGIYKGRYNYKVYKYELSFDDLPKDFDGYQITHISDIHAGSLKNKNNVEYAVRLINQQNSNLILFTGDLINNKSNELTKWKDIFSKMIAFDGKFSVLGNHDYGDYINWNNNKEKEDNFSDLIDFQKQMGFKLLLNENVKIKKGESNIYLIGVENWGKGRFKKKGDIDKACIGLNSKDFKIVLSHDPSHWDKVLIDHKTHFHLTLSGHTHGMQFGIEIPGWIKWSPAKWAYRHWAGLYHEKNQYLNVNRGFGVLGFPGRVGMPPEISVITLKKT
ncbi:MAG: metallophosphoesterase [Flavobacteriaceae bacterium]|nr:metallophosphoesterase [Flavobacteriaceae bacterium]